MVDITLKAGSGSFCYRVGAIILKDNKVLMVKNSSSPYFYSVGGRVKFGESSENAILRETYEETSIHFKIDRLAFVHENFFTADFANNESYHEISFYYIMQSDFIINEIECRSICINGGKESLHWLPIDNLSDFELYPEFFKTELKNISDNIKHFLTKEGRTYSCL